MIRTSTRVLASRETPRLISTSAWRPYSALSLLRMTPDETTASSIGGTRTYRRHAAAAANGTLISSPLLVWTSGRRSLSTSSAGGGEGDNSSGSNGESVDETLNRLFEKSQQQISAAGDSGDAWFTTATTDTTAAAAASAFEPTWYNLADQAVVFIQTVHDLSGIEYGWSIVGVTVLLRCALFPIMVQTQQTSSRMAHVQPEMQHIKMRYDALDTPSRQDQLQFSKNVKALFAKYQVKPSRAFLAPIIQLPLFMGMFFGLKKMPLIYPDELSTGGMFWFTDLTVADPLYILPVLSAGSFILLIEMGKEQMLASNAANPAQGQVMLNVMRVLSITMLPVCMTFDSAMLVYWTTNSLLSVLQTAFLKQRGVRRFFGIWDPPKPVPGAAPQMGSGSLKEAATHLLQRLQGQRRPSPQDEIAAHNRVVQAKKMARSSLHQNNNRKQRRMGITGTRNDSAR